ncbi:MAG: PKD domain-containing protein [Bacteroidota bacterium]
MKTDFFKKLIGLTLGVFSISAFAQCPSITNLSVTLGANGTASISPVISGTVSPAMTMYYWQISPSGNLTSNSFQSQGEFQFYSNGTYNVCLSFTDSLNGCWSNQYCDSITITNLPASSCNAAFTAYSDSNCVTYFVNASTGNNITYGWTINGSTYTSTNPSVNLPNGNHVVLLQTYYAGQMCDSVYHTIPVGCSGNNTVSCVANFTAFTDTACITHITNTSGGSNLTYEWYDVTNSSSPTLISTVVNPVLNLPQGYSVIQLATFSNGTFCDSAINYVYVNCGNPATGCQANSQFVIFPDSANPTSGNYYAYNTSYGSGTMSYLWNFGDGNTSTQQYPFHQYAVPGQYVVCLTVNVTYTTALGTSTCTDTYCDSSSVQKMAAGFLMSQMNVIPQTVTGIKQIESITGLKVFPNPIADELHVELAATDAPKLSYSLIDALGRTVLTGSLDAKVVMIHTSHLEKGFYTLNLFNDGGKTLKTIKLVK